MPKITTAGPSNALGRDPDWDPFGTGPEGGDDVSPGSSSSASSRSETKSSPSTPPAPLSPAPTTASPSAPPQTAKPSSTAPLTGGNTPATGSAQSGSEEAPPPLRAPKQEWAEHAVATGAVPPEEVENLTKAEIVEQVTATDGTEG